MQTLDDINLRETGQLVYPKQRASTKQRFPFGDTKCDFFSVSFLNFCAIKMKLLEFYVQLFSSACLIRLKLMHFFFFFSSFFLKREKQFAKDLNVRARFSK